MIFCSSSFSLSFTLFSIVILTCELYFDLIIEMTHREQRKSVERLSTPRGRICYAIDKRR